MYMQNWQSSWSICCCYQERFCDSRPCPQDDINTLLTFSKKWKYFMYCNWKMTAVCKSCTRWNGNSSCTLTFQADKHSIDKMKQFLSKINSVVASQVKEKKTEESVKLETDQEQQEDSLKPKVIKLDLTVSSDDPCDDEIWVSLDSSDCSWTKPAQWLL